MNIMIVILLVLTLILGEFGSTMLFGWPLGLGVFLVVAAACGLLVWAATRVARKIWVYAGLVTLAALMFPTSTLLAFDGFESWTALALFSLPSLALIVISLLLASGLNAYREGQVPVQFAAGAFMLGALLLVKTLYNLYWLLVWDSTTDSLDFLWLIVPGGAALFSGVMLLFILAPRVKWAGIAYALTIPALMAGVFFLAKNVDHRQLTESRAERINLAVEYFYEREGRYPRELSELTPRHLLSLPGPVVIYGQDWCYESGDGYYRLGYLDREHWSDPRLIGVVYKSKGEASTQQRMCEDQVAVLQQSHPGYMYSYRMEISK